MRTVQLGAGVAQTPPSLMDAQAIIDQITQAVYDAISRQIKQPVINIPPAVVNVAAPQVSVAAPVMPDVEPPSVDVTVPGLEAMANKLESVDLHLQQIIALLAQPVIREVQRGPNDLIRSVTERRT